MKVHWTAKVQNPIDRALAKTETTSLHEALRVQQLQLQ